LVSQVLKAGQRGRDMMSEVMQCSRRQVFRDRGERQIVDCAGQRWTDLC